MQFFLSGSGVVGTHSEAMVDANPFDSGCSGGEGALHKQVQILPARVKN